MKSAPSSLLTDLAKGVTTLATLVTLIRDDGTTIHFTQHDTTLIVDGVTFRNDIPYNLSAIDTNSDLSVDSTTLEVAIDGVVFTHADIANDLYRGGRIEIALVDWADLTAGKMVLRQGWFTQLQDNRPNVLNLEIGGLMKVLDMGVGRIYQPGCDADLGDTRCRIAIDPSQAYSPYNPYVSGDWAYVYDKSLMTSLGGTNLGFESGPTTGWTASSGSHWQNLPVGFSAFAGTKVLTGDTLTANAPEQFIYQDFALTPAMTTSDIDAGKVAFAAFVMTLQHTDTATAYPRIRCEILDANGAVLDSLDTRYLTLDAADQWREQCLHANLKPGARTVRVYLYAKTKTGTVARVAFDRVQIYAYNWLTTQPHHNLIFKAQRTVDFNAGSYDYAIANGSFENATSAVSTTENILGWTKAGSPWGVVNEPLFGFNTSQSGFYIAKAGDNGSAVLSTYTLENTVTFNASWINTARMALGKYVGRFTATVFWGDASSQAGIVLTFLDASNTPIGTVTALADTAKTGATRLDIESRFTFPIGTAKMKITLRAIGSSAANIGFDAIRLRTLDPERPDWTQDLTSAFGDPLTVFDYTSGHFSQDGDIVWRAFPTWRLADVVSAVTDRKTFAGTDIVGDFGAYETGVVEWLSGNNAGRRSIIRTWFPPTKQLKVYFPLLHDIQVGDRYAYIPGCQKRFREDCIFKFNNALNFQGFPYLPGSIAPTISSDPPLNEDAPASVPALSLSNMRRFGNVVSATLTFPVDLKVGDLMVAIAWNSATLTVPTMGNQWTLITSHASNNGGSHQVSASIYAKIATAQDVADGAITITNATIVGGAAATPSEALGRIVINTPVKSNDSGTAGFVHDITPPKENGVSLAGIYVALTGMDNANAITVDTTQLLSGPVFGNYTVKYPNLFNTVVSPRSIDQTSVKCGTQLNAVQNNQIYGYRMGSGSTSACNIAIGVFVGVAAASP